jgi:hypothetical protein
MCNYKIVIFTALELEIKFFKKFLKTSSKVLYEDKEVQIVFDDFLLLIKTGVGNKNLDKIFRLLEEKKIITNNDILVNFGFCGFKKGNIGDLYLIDKIIFNNKSYYPDLMNCLSFERETLETVEKIKNPQKYNSLIDMEAGFLLEKFFLARSPHLFRFYKLVSDQEINKNLKKKELEKILEKKVDLVWQDLKKISEKYFVKKKFFLDNKINSLKEEIEKEVYFTFSQKKQLAKLLHSFVLIYPNFEKNKDLFDFIKQEKSKKIKNKDLVNNILGFIFKICF